MHKSSSMSSRHTRAYGIGQVPDSGTVIESLRNYAKQHGDFSEKKANNFLVRLRIIPASSHFKTQDSQRGKESDFSRLILLPEKKGKITSAWMQRERETKFVTTAQHTWYEVRHIQNRTARQQRHGTHVIQQHGPQLC